MPRRTREQKIIAELRRKLKVQPIKTPRQEPVVNAVPEISLPKEIKSPPERSVAEPIETTAYLKKDLLRFAALALAVTAFELIVSYMILSGTLKFI
jgi:hypothetical protein